MEGGRGVISSSISLFLAFHNHFQRSFQILLTFYCTFNGIKEPQIFAVAVLLQSEANFCFFLSFNSQIILIKVKNNLWISLITCNSVCSHSEKKKAQEKIMRKSKWWAFYDSPHILCFCFHIRFIHKSARQVCGMQTHTHTSWLIKNKRP